MEREIFDTFLLVDSEDHDMDVVAFIEGLRKGIPSLVVIALYRTSEGKKRVFDSVDKFFDKDEELCIKDMERWINLKSAAAQRRSNPRVTVLIDGEEEKMGIDIETIVKDLQLYGGWKIGLLLGNEEQREKLEWVKADAVFMKPGDVEEIVRWIQTTKEEKEETE